MSLALSSDGGKILTGSAGGTVTIWDRFDGKILRSFQAHEQAVCSVAFSPSGNQFVSAGDRVVKLWNATEPFPLVHGLRLNMMAWAAAFSPDGQRIITGSGSGIATVWDAASGKPLVTINAHQSRIRVVAFSPDNQRILTGSEDHTVKIWDAATPEQVAAWDAEE
jgi:WD40 repeat protein